METKTINIKDIKTNDGQIEGLPRNPRQIRDARFEALKKSITDAPEMLKLRELLVYPYEDKFVIIGGNMRYRACKELGFTELPCKVLDVDTPKEKLREYAIKDNENFGQYDWDIVANEWDEVELGLWGVELPTEWGKESENPYVQNTEVPIYEIKGEKPTENQCVDLSQVNQFIARIDGAKINNEQKNMLKACAYRFANINFQNLAEYYAHQDEKMQELMEDLALVIVDFNKAIENGLVVMDTRLKDIYDDEK